MTVPGVLHDERFYFTKGDLSSDLKQRGNRLCRRNGTITHCTFTLRTDNCMQSENWLGAQIFGYKTGAAVIATHLKSDVFDFDFQPPPTGGTDLNVVRCAHNPLSKTSF
jgi:hypothetical protein